MGLDAPVVVVLRVLVGEEAFVETLHQAAAQRGTAPWIVPKKAALGDKVALFFPHVGFLGYGEIMSNPKSTVFGRRQTYSANVGQIVLFQSPIPLDRVAERFPEWAWVRYPRSFTSPAPEMADQLFRFLLIIGQDNQEVRLPEEVASSSPYCEGSVQQILVNRYERDPRAREECIRQYGARCDLCQFDFVAAYGEVMEGFIHVHHLKPISSVGANYEVDPIRDLRPVCPNCHAVLHRREPPYSLDEVRKFLQARPG